MTITEIVVDETRPETNDERVSRAWKLDILGKSFTIERFVSPASSYGFCSWNKIRLLKEGREVYKIMLNEEERNEFFNDQLCRTYQGNQYSFLEYLFAISEKGKFPEPKEVLCLDSEIEMLYRRNVEELINK